MCGVCGCGEPNHHHHDHHHDGHSHHHHHDHHHDHDPAPASAETARRVQVERDILERNDQAAARNRAAFQARGVLALNLVSSPGAGKTTLLTRTLRDLGGDGPAGVIVGDQASELDAARLRETGVPARQVTTGRACHLDAEQVADALPALDLPDGATLFIENVGNLVCPAGFDLGERAKVLLVSTAEGADKAEKYPHMFAAADLLLVTKIDLLPHLDCDVDGLIGAARRINPDLDVLQVSATRGDGLDDWYAWLRRGRVALAAAAA